MGGLKADEDDKKELDDSGYVQEEGPHKSSLDASKQVSLLDLSDDVLLGILGYCRPSDLKALGFTCARLASLTRDRPLWQRVDARSTPLGRRRLRWLLEHALHAGTTSLKIKGFAKDNAGCQGYVNRLRREGEARQEFKHENCGGYVQYPPSWNRDFACFPLPRPSVSPSWPEDDPPPVSNEINTSQCPGPVFTLTPCLLRQMSLQCSLTELSLEYCNINCSAISLSHFPPGLKYLSLKGAKCFNMALDKSFLFKIQDHLPNIEHLDLSESSWLDPSSLLPLSKLLNLRNLYMSSCPRLTEFVAYASLAARYGFRKLKIFDLRGSPLGDSEAAALGWLPELEELYLSSADPCDMATHPKHEHYVDDVLPKTEELSDWEAQEPEYFKSFLKQHKRSKLKEDECCFHGLPFNHCLDGFRENSRKKTTKRTAQNIDEPGPSKKKKSDAGSSCESDDDDETNGDEEMNEKCDGNDQKTVKIKNCGKGYVKFVNTAFIKNFNGEGSSKKINNDEVNVKMNSGNGEVNSVNNDNSDDNEEENANGDVNNSESNDNNEANDNGEVNEERNGNGEENEANGEANRIIEVRPRAHVLYVNVGHQLHPVYRLAIPNEPGANEFRRWPVVDNQPLAMSYPTHNPRNHSLITDSAIRSFGHSEDDNINYFHIGGPPNAQNSRPNKSNLRILSVVGYKNITDRSLTHLMSSAPKLEVIDFSQTSVTEDGVSMFKVSRPDVEVKFCRFVEPSLDYSE